MGAHRKSIVKESIDLLEEMMAIGESRYAAKQAIREEHGKAWSVSDGKIHSFKTRSTYQEHSIRFAQALYLHYAPGQNLPPAEGRLKQKDYDRAAAERVTWALGHNRIDVVLRHYIR